LENSKCNSGKQQVVKYAKLNQKPTATFKEK